MSNLKAFTLCRSLTVYCVHLLYKVEIIAHKFTRKGGGVYYKKFLAFIAELSPHSKNDHSRRREREKPLSANRMYKKLIAFMTPSFKRSSTVKTTIDSGALWNRFALFDTASKGYFENDDIRRVLQEMGFSPNKRQISAIIRKISNQDSDNPKIRFPQFCTFVRQRLQDPPQVRHRQLHVHFFYYYNLHPPVALDKARGRRSRTSKVGNTRKGTRPGNALYEHACTLWSSKRQIFELVWIRRRSLF
jgi:hypothetical protein